MKGSELTISEMQELLGRDFLKFKYKNWKDAISDREVKPINVFYGGSDYHKHNDPRLFLKAYDLEKQSIRHFLIDDIIEVYAFERVKVDKRTKRKVPNHFVLEESPNGT